MKIILPSRGILLSAWILITIGTAAAPAAEADKPADPASDRILHTLKLPKPAQKERILIEITAGKTIETDGVNRYFMGGAIQVEERDGRRIFVVKTGAVASTRMGADPGHPKGTQFVSVTSGLLSHDSTQPMLIEAAKDLTITYRLWTAGETKPIDATATAAAIAKAGRNMNAYKPAEPGMALHAASLEKLPDEQSARVEVIAGVSLTVDHADRASLSGDIRESSIPGWGFTRIDVSIGELTHAKAAKNGTPSFVALGGEPKIFSYNSRLPVVVYAPKEAEVRYRIWTPGKQVPVK